MERLMTWAMRHPRRVLVGILVVSLAAATQLPSLQIAISPQSLIIEGDPDQQFYDDTLATFGSDRITIVFLSDPQLFDPAKLAAIREVAANLKALPFVTKTRSLFNVPDVRVTGDLVTTDPYLAQLPEDPASAAEIRQRALMNPFVRKNLFSPDGTAMAINVYLKDDEYAADPAFDVHVSQAIDRAIAPLNGVVRDCYQIGLPYVRSEIARSVEREQYQTMGAAFAVLFVALLIMFRKGTALVIPLTTASLSVLWLLGAMAALDIPLSVLTAVVPVLLVIIGSTEDTHLLAEYYDGVSRRLGRRRAIKSMTRRLGLAIGLTFLTSYLGFLTVSANPIGLVREFGLVASTGLAINFLLTALLVPVLLGMFGETGMARGRGRIARAYDGLTAWMTRRILAYRKTFLALGLAALVGSLYAASGLQVNNNLLNYFSATSPIQGRIANLRSHLAGLYTLQVVVDGHLDGAFDRVQYLEELQKIQRYLHSQPAFDHSMSIADYLSLLNSAVNETGKPELPEEDDVVETLMLFVGPDDVGEYLSDDHSKASIVVRHGVADSATLEAALKDLKAFVAAKVDSDLAVTVTGESVLTDNAVNYLMAGQIRSLALILVAIFAVVALLFVAVKAGLIALVVNVFPVAGLFGVMGVAGIPLDSATSMIAAIAVGIGVDNTVHFMVRYNWHFRGRVDEITAVSRTIRDEAKPIGAATLALAAGFGTLMLSDFPPIYDFGVLSAMTVLFAFVATFVLAPILLSFVRLITLWDMLGTKVRRELVARCPLFRGLRPLQVRRVILLGRVTHYADGETIMAQGELAHEMYVLLRGRVALDSKHPGAAVTDKLNVATVGEVFGLAAPICGKPRLVTATALGPVEVLALDWERLQRIARFFPRSAYLLFKNLSAIMGERLADRVVPPDRESSPPVLAEVGTGV